MKKIFFVIALLIIFPIIINSIYSEETIDELLESADVEASLGTEQNFSNAIKDYEKILDIEPDNVFALNGKAAMLILLKEIDEAELLIDKALEIEPEFVSALSNKGIILQYNNEKDLALEIFNKALEIESNNIDVLFNKANLLKSNDIEQSIKILNQIIELDKNNIKAMNEIQNLLDGIVHVRIDGYIQMAIRDKNGSLIGYTESDVVVITNSTYIETILFRTADSITELEIGEEKFWEVSMSGSVPLIQGKTPAKSGISIFTVFSYPNGNEVKFNPIIFRTHGYINEDGDTAEELVRVIIPKKPPIE